jgi:spermidine/putrescine transport system ATP-binding protein
MAIDQSSAGAPPAVRLDTVRKSFGGTEVVRGVSLEVGAGEFYALLGPSGCGKTTTLKLIGGFEQPDTGQVLIGGEPVEGVPAFKRDVNTVFQNYALFPHLDVRDNVAFGLRMSGVKRSERRSRAEEALERVHLPGAGRRRIEGLSGGEQQRVALARAIINRPSVLLLDEPLGALDLKLRRAMQQELKEIQRSVGICFIYVTHDQHEALAMADRMAVMKDGVIQQQGSPEEIYDRPESRYVAQFIGDAGFLEGELVGVDAGLSVVSLPGGHRLRAPESGLVVGPSVIAVRPERARLSPVGDPESPDRNYVEGTVTEVEFLGSDRVYRVAVPPAGELVVRETSVGTPVQEPGSRVTVEFDIAAAVALPGDVSK